MSYQQQPYQGGIEPWATEQRPGSGVAVPTSQHSQVSQTLEDALSGDMRLTLHDFVQAATVCEWCAEQCLDGGPQMAECARLCRDVADLALLNVRFITRDSVFGPDVAETFAYAAQECARECSRHPHEHCQESVNVLNRAIDSTWQLLQSIGHRPQGQPTSGATF